VQFKDAPISASSTNENPHNDGHKDHHYQGLFFALARWFAAKGFGN
jgi:hypothetical protein